MPSLPKCCRIVRPENSARSFKNPAPVLTSPAVMRLLRGRKGKKVLEVGAGCLRNSLFLQSQRFRVTVLEVPGMEARFPRQYKSFRRRSGRLVASLQEYSQFDFAVATFVFETICDPRIRKGLLRRVFKALRRGGFLIVSARGPKDVLTATSDGVRCSNGYLTPNLTFSRAYTRKQLQPMLVAAGFARVQFLHKKSTREPELLNAVAWREN